MSKNNFNKSAQPNKYKAQFTNEEIEALDTTIDAELVLFDDKLPDWVMEADDVFQEVYYDSNLKLLQTLLPNSAEEVFDRYTTLLEERVKEESITISNRSKPTIIAATL